MRSQLALTRLILVALVFGGYADRGVCDDTQPLSPTDGLASIVVRDGFQVELVASEPLVKDPVAFDWDANGRLWVVEMADYPLGIDGKGKQGGRVRRLTDTDGDGRYDESTLFLDGLSFPNGILTWRDGVLITAAPDIIYAADTNGDGKADVQKKLFTGFNQGNQQLRVNGLRWGLDNWIYCASGSHHPGYGAKTGITVVATGERVTVGSRDFRIRPDAGLIDPQSGPSQFGRNRDDWGNWFGVQNSYPIWHYVLADHYIRRNPFYAPPSPRNDLTKSNPTVYPIKKPQKRFHSFENATQFTSACSGNVYRDGVLFGSGEGTKLQHSFTCEPFHSMVQHNLLRAKGTSFTLQRDPAEQKSEFFASRDRWCRPVMVRTGPDGALWIADMYRYMIEHPQWVNEAAQNELRPYYRHGEDHGRIYRVSPKGSQTLPVAPNLASLDIASLVERLAESNGWVRDKCHQLLLWRNDKAAIEPLQELVGNSPVAVARLHALCVLDGMNALDARTLSVALDDTHAGVRRHALRLAETRESDQVVSASLRLASDSDDSVRLQLASSIGAFNDERAIPVLVQLATDPRNDQYVRAAAMSSVSQRNVEAFALGLIRAKNPDGAMLRTVFRMLYEDKNTAALELLVQAMLSPGQSDRVTDAGVTSQPGPVTQTGRVDQALGDQFTTVASLLDEVPLAQVTNDRLKTVLANAGRIASDGEQASGLRLKAISLLAREPQLAESSLARIRELLTPRQSPTIQSSVVARVSRRSESAIADVLLEGWHQYSPQLRSQVVNALLGRVPWTGRLLDRIESNHIDTGELGTAVRQRLLEHKNAKLRSRATELISLSQTDKAGILQTYRAAFELETDKIAGQKVFQEKCASCHRIDGVGKEVGPNLAALTDKTDEALLTSILDPNRAVDAKYMSYSVTDANGRTHTGLVATETASSLTLITSDVQTVTVLRSDVDELATNGRSLMPDGFEKDLSLQQFADLIAYLQSH